ncbi:MAG: hypothetical protein WC308_03740 [archaeon]|jgi:hypothetical protein
MKKILTILLIFVLIGSAFAALPEPTQLSYNPSPAVPGSTITLLVQVTNQTSSLQQGVIVRIDENYPFTIKEEKEKNIGDIDAFGQSIVQFTAYVDPSAENKTYPLSITIYTQNNASGKKTSFPIVISGKKPIVKVINISETKLVPGEEKEIIFTLQNVGTSSAYDVLIELQEDRTVTATGIVVEREILPLGAGTAHIVSIMPGEQQTAKMEISVNKEATLQNYILPVVVTYRDSAGTIETQTSYIGFKVSSLVDIDATLKETSAPLIAGNTTDLTIELFNKGNGKADFIIAQVESDCGTTSEIKQFIGTLEPNDVDSFKETLKVNSDTKTGPCKIKINLNYEDTDATTKSKTIELTGQAYSQEDGAALNGSGTSPLMLIIVLAIIVVAGYLIWKRMKVKKNK